MSIERDNVERARELFRQRKFAQAAAALESALRQREPTAALLFNLGTSYEQEGRLGEAAECFRRALALEPRLADAHLGLGRALLKADRSTEALESLERARALRPYVAEIHLLAGRALLRKGHAMAAGTRFEQALQLDPHLAEAHYFRGVVCLTVTGNMAESVASFDRALAIDPNHFRSHEFRARALVAAGDLAGALASLQRMLELRPGDVEALSQLLNCQVMQCDWSQAERTLHALRNSPEGTDATHPFFLMAVCDDPEAHRRAAGRQAALTQRVLERSEPAPRVRSSREKIRLAYVSCDFFQHATSILLVELLELHDRSQFEVVGVSFGPGDRSPLRARVMKSFDQFIDVTSLSDLEVARRLREREIDVAIDLKGYTASSRPGIFGYRPAPIAVNYLGYPGTLAAPYVDYLIADEFLIPEADRAFYAEKIAYLPDSYQVNDRRRAIADTTPSRADVGLPENGFVFCCFNNSWKITEVMFDIWMRLLADIESSVLWLLKGNAWAEENLKREAAKRAISAERLVFGERVRHEDHLARHRLADLFLDTLPVNAHTTASDALWSGLPVITCAGRAMPGRVAGSLLRAVGLTDLITSSLEEYERLASRLARDPGLLQAIRAKLSRERERLPLFDTPRYCRHLEAAYRHMWLRHRQGDPPETFRVERISWNQPI